MQHLKSEAGVHFFVAGGAGAGLRVSKPHERAVFARNVLGFSVLEATDSTFQVRFIGIDLKELYTHTISK
jgi:hypothetical protein